MRSSIVNVSVVQQETITGISLLNEGKHLYDQWVVEYFENPQKKWHDMDVYPYVLIIKHIILKRLKKDAIKNNEKFHRYILNLKRLGSKLRTVQVDKCLFILLIYRYINLKKIEK